ncbi:hypothetical protein HDU79_010530 [Rhizoclosmatium sp. JEL0117]|nr:hypothetical protein HDU79_010530 [Rhizoclosmatium sp. JEL0117]
MFRVPANHFITDLQNETLTLTAESQAESGIPSNATLYFKGLKGCTITVQTPCTKVFIERCVDTKVTLSSRIVTQMLEVWKSNGVDISVDTTVFTVQADDVRDSSVVFGSKEQFGQVVWTNCAGLAVSVKEEQDSKLVVGLEGQSAPEGITLVESDQFIVRFVDGILTSELVVRVGTGGFTTTIREDDRFIEKQNANMEKLSRDIMNNVKAVPK